MTPLPIGRRGPGAWAVLGVAAVAGAAFLASLQGGLVLDDDAFLPGNPKLAAVRTPLELFRSGVWDYANVEVSDPLYRPLFMVVLWIGDAVLALPPWGWHAFAVLLHVACAALTWLLLRRLIPEAPWWTAVAGALLFAVHPVHVEAVAWILAFGHPLATALVLAAAVLLVGDGVAPNAARQCGAAVLAGSAMLVAEAAFAAPALLVAVDAARHARFRRATLLAQAGAMVLVFGLRTAVTRDPVPLAFSGASVGTAVSFGAAYLRHLAWPFPQYVYLAVPRGGVADLLSCVMAPALVVAAAWLVWRWRGRGGAIPALGVAWVAIGVGPVVLAAMGPRPLFALRAMYLASVGLSILAAWAASQWARPSLARFGVPVVVAGALACNAVSWSWRDNLAVYGRAVRATPEFSPVHTRLGVLLAERGQTAAAERHLRDGVSLARDASERIQSRQALATQLGATGRIAEAEQVLMEVVAEAPGTSAAWVGLGNVAWLRGDRALARDRYLEAVRLDERNYEAAYDAALALEALGEADRAALFRARANALGPGARR